MATRYLLVVAVCVASNFIGNAQEKPKSDDKIVQGSWDWDPAAKQSEAEPKILLDRIVIAGDTLTFHYDLDGKKFTSATTFKLMPKGSPKEIDFSPSDAAKKAAAYRGLYEVTDGQLKICYRGPGASRPKDFNDLRDGNNVTVFIILKRTPKT